MKNFYDLAPGKETSNDSPSEFDLLSDAHIENQIALNQDSEIDYLLDQYSSDFN